VGGELGLTLKGGGSLINQQVRTKGGHVQPAIGLGEDNLKISGHKRRKGREGLVGIGLDAGKNFLKKKKAPD